MPTNVLFGLDNTSFKLSSGIIGDFPLGSSVVTLFYSFLKEKNNRFTSKLLLKSFLYAKFLNREKKIMKMFIFFCNKNILLRTIKPRNGNHVNR